MKVYTEDFLDTVTVTTDNHICCLFFYSLQLKDKHFNVTAYHITN